MSTLHAESQALIEELEQSLSEAPPEMRPIVEAQIENLRRSMRMLEEARPQMEANKQYRAPLSAEARTFYTPHSGPEIPTWVPDTLQRAQVTEAWLRCPAGAVVYPMDTSFVCAIPRGIGTIPTRHGLSLDFYHSGMLRSQGYYEHGLLRWSITYHANGGRETFGLYTDRVEREHLPHGLHTTLTSAGTPIAQTYYHAGIRHGWSRLWEEDGYPAGATLYDQGREIDHLLADGSRRPS